MSDDTRPSPTPLDDGRAVAAGSRTFMPHDEGFGYSDPDRQAALITRAILRYEEDLVWLRARDMTDIDPVNHAAELSATEARLAELRAELDALRGGA